MRLTRLYVENVKGPLRAGALVAVDGERAHYLSDVLRLRLGDAVTIFDGVAGAWRACLQRSSDGRVLVLRVEAYVRPQETGPDLWLLFAPLKRQATDWVVQKATELGVARLCPVLTERSATLRFNPQRARGIAIEAAEQCGRLDIPDIAVLSPLPQALAAWLPQRRLYVGAEAGDALPAAAALTPPLTEGGPAAFLIGPEGGFSTAELAFLGARPFVRKIGLGPRVLRAETAAIAALACWQALCGDGRARPPEIP